MAPFAEAAGDLLHPPPHGAFGHAFQRAQKGLFVPGKVEDPAREPSHLSVPSPPAYGELSASRGGQTRSRRRSRSWTTARRNPLAPPSAKRASRYSAMSTTSSPIRTVLKR